MKTWAIAEWKLVVPVRLQIAAMQLPYAAWVLL